VVRYSASVGRICAQRRLRSEMKERRRPPRGSTE